MLLPEELRDRDTRHEAALRIAQETARMAAAQVEREVMNQLNAALANYENTGRNLHDGRRVGREATWHAMRDWMYHGLDMGRAMVDRPLADTLTGEFSWSDGFAFKEFELHGWTAKCLTSAEAVREEGRTMEHCLGEAYIVRIAQGDYLAYHIQPPAGQGYPRSGFTLGIEKNMSNARSTWVMDQVKSKRNQTHYNDDVALKSLTEMIVELVG